MIFLKKKKISDFDFDYTRDGSFISWFSWKLINKKNNFGIYKQIHFIYEEEKLEEICLTLRASSKDKETMKNYKEIIDSYKKKAELKDYIKTKSIPGKTVAIAKKIAKTKEDILNFINDDILDFINK